MITILVIDDDPETRAVTDGWLNNSEFAYGHQLVYAGTDEGALTAMGVPPDECLELANDVLCSYGIPGMFGPVVCVLIGTTSRTICYSDGGHLPMLINRTRHRGPSQIGESGGPMLGVVPGEAYT